MSYKIFSPRPSDKDSMVDLLRQAISEGEMVYPFLITPDKADMAALVFTYIFNQAYEDGTIALAIDEETNKIVGFEAFVKYKLCDLLKLDAIYDGLLTYILPDHRQKGIATDLRKFFYSSKIFKKGDKFRASIQKGNSAGRHSLDKITDICNINITETGVTYEGQVTNIINI